MAKQINNIDPNISRTFGPDTKWPFPPGTPSTSTAKQSIEDPASSGYFSGCLSARVFRVNNATQPCRKENRAYIRLTNHNFLLRCYMYSTLPRMVSSETSLNLSAYFVPIDR